MLLRIQHETKLSYSDPVTETVFEVRMAPPSDEDQTNLGYRLRIVPSAPVTIYRDGFGNRVDLFNILTAYQRIDHPGDVDRADAPGGVGRNRGWPASSGLPIPPSSSRWRRSNTFSPARW